MHFAKRIAHFVDVPQVFLGSAQPIQVLFASNCVRPLLNIFTIICFIVTSECFSVGMLDEAFVEWVDAGTTFGRTDSG